MTFTITYLKSTKVQITGKIWLRVCDLGMFSLNTKTLRPEVYVSHRFLLLLFFK